MKAERSITGISRALFMKLSKDKVVARLKERLFLLKCSEKTGFLIITLIVESAKQMSENSGLYKMVRNRKEARYKSVVIQFNRLIKEWTVILGKIFVKFFVIIYFVACAKDQIKPIVTMVIPRSTKSF